MKRQYQIKQAQRFALANRHFDIGCWVVQEKGIIDILGIVQGTVIDLEFLAVPWIVVGTDTCFIGIAPRAFALKAGYGADAGQGKGGFKQVASPLQ